MNSYRQPCQLNLDHIQLLAYGDAVIKNMWRQEVFFNLYFKVQLRINKRMSQTTSTRTSNVRLFIIPLRHAQTAISCVNKTLYSGESFLSLPRTTHVLIMAPMSDIGQTQVALHEHCTNIARTQFTSITCTKVA